MAQERLEDRPRQLLVPLGADQDRGRDRGTSLAAVEPGHPVRQAGGVGGASQDVLVERLDVEGVAAARTDGEVLVRGDQALGELFVGGTPADIAHPEALATGAGGAVGGATQVLPVLGLHRVSDVLGGGGEGDGDRIPRLPAVDLGAPVREPRGVRRPP